MRTRKHLTRRLLSSSCAGASCSSLARHCARAGDAHRTRSSSVTTLLLRSHPGTCRVSAEIRCTAWYCAAPPTSISCATCGTASREPRRHARATVA
eukprot:9157516-Pyramimonas_sp.AAC.1